jgi:CelD/BcsL family acetyltransferase involved in cellulose biosynthesis
VELLDAEADERRWLELWRSCGREPFAHPAYGRLFAGAGERPIALVIDQPTGVALLPLLIRRVRDDRYDAVSPYGYGGPFFSTGGAASGDAVASVFDAVARWAGRERLCSVFLRLSLDLAPFDRTEVVEAAHNVVVDLRRAPERLWGNYQHKVRKNVNKALRAGCTVSRLDLLADVDGFLDVYGATMRRRAAAPWYHFDRSFIGRFAADLSGTYSTFAVRDRDGRMVSVEIVLESDRFLYSFLGGTLEEAFPVSPNDLLKHEIVGHGQRTGRGGFVLGGGHQPGDGIFRYKRAFDPTGVRPFRVAKIVGDRHRYTELVAARGPAAGTGFFPAYRAPVTTRHAASAGAVERAAP